MFWLVSELPIPDLPADLVESLNGSGHLFVVEEHTAHGGLGHMLVHRLACLGKMPARFTHRYALGYVSGRYGSQNFHRRECGLDAASILKALTTRMIHSQRRSSACRGRSSFWAPAVLWARTCSGSLLMHRERCIWNGQQAARLAVGASAQQKHRRLRSVDRFQPGCDVWPKVRPRTIFDCVAYGAYSFETDSELIYQTNFKLDLAPVDAPRSPADCLLCACGQFV